MSSKDDDDDTSTIEPRSSGRLSPSQMSERGRNSQIGKARVAFSSAVQNITKFCNETEDKLETFSKADIDNTVITLNVYGRGFTDSYNRIEYLTFEGEIIPIADQKLYDKTAENILELQRKIQIRKETFAAQCSELESRKSRTSGSSHNSDRRRAAILESSLAEMKMATERVKQEADKMLLQQQEQFRQTELQHTQKIRNLELQIDLFTSKMKEKLESTDDDKLGDFEEERHTLIRSIHGESSKNKTFQQQSTPSVKATTKFTPVTPTLQASTSQKGADIINSSTPSATTDVEKLGILMGRATLPPLKPIIFKGDRLVYQKWRNSFRVCFEKRTEDPDELASYLADYTSGEAYRLIESNLHVPSKANFDKAMDKLEAEYGNPVAICEEYIHKLETWEKIKPYQAKPLKEFANFLDSCFESLSGFGRASKLNDASVIRRAMELLPGNLKTSFREEVRKHREKGTEPTFDFLVDFVRKRAKALGDPVYGEPEKPDTMLKTTDNKRYRYKASNNSTGATTNDVKTVHKDGYTKPKPTPYCLYCKNEHWLEHCPDLRKKPVQERRDFLKTKNMCYKCTYKGHNYKDCPNDWKTCQVCNQKGHISLFHTDFQHKLDPTAPKFYSNHVNVSSNSTTNQTENDTDEFDDLAHITLGYIRHRDHPSDLTPIYIYTDAEADSCFIETEFATDKGWTGEDILVELTTMHGTQTVNCRRLENLEILNFDTSEVFQLPSCYTREELPISRRQIPTRRAAESFDHLKHISQEIPELTNANIVLMIGRNVPLATSPREVIPPVSSTSPWAERNGLGWSILHARKPTHLTCNYVNIRNPSTGEEDSRLLITEHESAKDVTTQEILRMFDREFTEDTQDDLGISKEDQQFIDQANKSIRLAMFDREFTEDTQDDLGISKEDQQFIDQANKSIRLADKKYTIDLPFRRTTPNLGNNLHIAQSSLDRLKKRFSKDENYAKEYSNFMEDAIRNGYIQKVPDNHSQTTTTHYLTHHGVFHKRKKKIRVVFDASLRGDGRSLNDELLKGPDYLTNLTGALCRMRKNLVAFTCDIAAMFMMVTVPEYQRDLLRILWWENGNYSLPPTDYHICYHLFGAVSSPACCIFALHQTVYDNKDDYSDDVSNFVLHDFYMDDGCTSADDVGQAIDIAEGAIDLCSRGGFNLCKFASNSKQFMQRLPVDKRSPDLTDDFDFEQDHLPQQRTLGMIWDIDNDILKYRADMPNSALTRRGCLSSLSTVFDPMGLISPLMLSGKRILQEACRLKLPWDEPLPTQLQDDWLQWKSNLNDLEDLCINRCHKSPEFGTAVDYQLHCFSDASTYGYGCCAYLRLRNDNNDIEVSLVMGKSRVIPLKQITIPRLELTGAVTSTNIAMQLQKELRIPNLQIYFWTDSTCVLGYLRNETRRFKTFVSNRIQRILNYSELDQWHHTPGTLNPADLASRGVNSPSLLKTSLWFKGPKYLHDTDEFWLEPETSSFEIDVKDTELKTNLKVLNTSTKQVPVNILTGLEKIGSWQKVKTTVAIWKHLIQIYKSRKLGVQIDPVFRKTAEKLESAETEIIKLIQKEHFPEEVSVLKTTGNQLKKSSSIIKLNPFLDEYGIIRVGGRIKHSSLNYNEKHLIIIPKTGHLTKLLILHCHEKCHHSGRNITLNQVRNKYWLINGPSVVQHFISGCVICTKLRGKPQTQRMSDLPPDRVNEAAPFTHSACDIFGPFLIKVRRSEVKRYGLLFSCQTSRAVHLEVLHSMTTDSFLCGLRRFICRRGTVQYIRSDRGSQIIGASNELEKLKQDLNKQKIKNDILKQFDCDIVFEPSTPYAPHFHGSWERQIGSIRRKFGILTFAKQSTSNRRIITDFPCRSRSNR